MGENSISQPTRIFEAVSHGFQVWYTSQDHPLEAMIERKPTPIVGQSQIIRRAREDDWLETVLEDAGSG